MENTKSQGNKGQQTRFGNIAAAKLPHLASKRMSKRVPTKKAAAAQSQLPSTSLELLVVGHRLNMRPMHVPLPAPTPTPTAKAPSTHSKANKMQSKKNVAATVTQLEQTSEKLYYLQNGDYIYIFDSYPLDPTQIENADLLETESLPVASQIVDSRFLAELLGELLIYTE